MTGLILEGGAFRGLFTAGVLDGLLEIGADLRYIVGVSAGATNAISYMSRQHGRNLKIMETYLLHPRYLGLSNFVRSRAIMDMDFVFDDIPHTGIPLDYEAFHAYPGKLMIGVYNVKTGKEEFFSHRALDEHSLLLRASCSIPMMFPFVRIGSRLYADGGLGDPIPVDRSIRDGNDRHLVVLTQRRGYIKSFGRTDAVMVERYRRRYPQLARTVENRYRRYNEQLSFCEELERAGSALILAPQVDFTVSRFERDKGKLRALYRDGRQQVLRRREELLRFTGGEGR